MLESRIDVERLRPTRIAHRARTYTIGRLSRDIRTFLTDTPSAADHESDVDAVAA